MKFGLFKGFVGSGRKYDSEKRIWEDHVKDILGYEPYKGTLNIAVRPKLTEQELNEYVVPSPFKDFVCVLGTVNDKLCHLCYSNKKADKNNEVSTFYVISDVQLRDTLNIQDKDKVDVRILKLLQK